MIAITAWTLGPIWRNAIIGRILNLERLDSPALSVMAGGVSEYGMDLREGEPPALPMEATRSYPTHPLFPLPEGVHETKEIYEITFDRWNDKGIKERCPDRFKAAELTSLAQIVDMFGGGTYQFIAFDSRGNFSRWTQEKEKVRIDVPSKPFRQIERAAGDAGGGAEHAHARGGHPQGDVLALILQQTMAAQERADRLMAVVIDRLAQQHAAPPPPPPMDPVAMMAGLATVLEKLRPAQAGDSLAQLSGLVGVIKQLSGTQPAESPADELLGAMTSMLKAAPLHAAMTPPALPQGQQGASPAMGRGAGGPPATPDMVWVMLPGVGPVMMRVDQAAKVVARMGAMPGAGTAAAGAGTPAAQAEVAQQAAPPAPQGVQPTPVAVTRPPEPPPMSTPAAVAPPAPPPPHASALPAAMPPAPAPVAPTVNTAATPPSPSSTEPATVRADRCIICGESGRRDPSQPEVLICRNNHKSLLSAQPPRAAARQAPPAQHEIEAMLADREVLSALTPDAIAAIRHMTTHRTQT